MSESEYSEDSSLASSVLDSLDASTISQSSSSSEEEEEEELQEELDLEQREGGDASLEIHELLTLEKLQQLKEVFFPPNNLCGVELDMSSFVKALSEQLSDMEGGVAEDGLVALFMKIDANCDGGVSWEEFTGYMLQLDEGTAAMTATATLQNLTLDTAFEKKRDHLRAYHRGMIEKIINVERAGIPAYISAGRDGMIRFWHKNSFGHFRCINHLDAVRAHYKKLLQGAEGSREGEGGARSGDIIPGTRVVEKLQDAWICDLEQLPLSSRVAVACMDRSVAFYDMLTGELASRIVGLSSAPTAIVCIEQGQDAQLVVFGDLEGNIHKYLLGRHFYIPDFFDTKQPYDVLAPSETMQAHSDAIMKMKFVSELNVLVSCSIDSKVMLTDLGRKKVIRTFHGHKLGVHSFDYCSTQRFIASVGMGREVIVWNPYTMDILSQMDGHLSTVMHCICDEEGGRIITCSADKVIKCWDVANYNCLQTFHDEHRYRPDDCITAMLWDPQRSVLVLAGNKFTLLRNQGTINQSSKSHEAEVCSALYTANFGQVVSADAAGTICVWSIDSGQMAFRFTGAHGDSKISAMCFDGSGRRLLTGANDGSMKIWNFSNGQLLRDLCPGTTGRGVGVGDDSREISSCLYVLESGGANQVKICFIASCSWDRHIRLYSDEGQNSPSKIIPPPTLEGSLLDAAGHSADVLAMCHCGAHLLATSDINGDVIMWRADTSRSTFRLRPALHELRENDDISSLGGFTSKDMDINGPQGAKGGLLFDDESSEGGYGGMGIAAASPLPEKGDDGFQVAGDSPGEQAREVSSIQPAPEGLADQPKAEGGMEGSLAGDEPKAEGGPEGSIAASSVVPEDVEIDLAVAEEGSADLYEKARARLEQVLEPQQLLMRTAKPPASVGSRRSRTGSLREANARLLLPSPAQVAPYAGDGPLLGPQIAGPTPPADQLEILKEREAESSHAVGVLLYLPSLNFLITGGATGDLHFWDCLDGCFLFGVKAAKRSAPQKADLVHEDSTAEEDNSRRAGRAGTRSLCVANRMWSAHQSTIVSIDYVDYKKKVVFLVTAGFDGNVHLWTISGAHIGTFGQQTSWILSQRATWKQPVDIEVLGYESDDSELDESEDSDEDASGESNRKAEKPDEPEQTRAQQLQEWCECDQEAGERAQEVAKFQQAQAYEYSKLRLAKKLQRSCLTSFCMASDRDQKEGLAEAQNTFENGRKTDLLAHLRQPPSNPADRLGSILRGTYNQVAFELKVHNPRDVVGRAKLVQDQRKERRITKSQKESATGAKRNGTQNEMADGRERGGAGSLPAVERLMQLLPTAPANVMAHTRDREAV